jgi:hypothetical protein
MSPLFYKMVAKMVFPPKPKCPKCSLEQEAIPNQVTKCIRCGVVLQKPR